MKKTWKRLCTGFLALATVVTALPTTPVHAESNPYCFLCGKTLVKVVFNEDAPTLDFCLINYFKSLKSY